MFVNLFFPNKLDGLRPGISFSEIVTFLIVTMIFGVNLSCVTLFYDPNREDFDIGEPISMPVLKF